MLIVPRFASAKAYVARPYKNNGHGSVIQEEGIGLAEGFVWMRFLPLANFYFLDSVFGRLTWEDAVG
jgi:hypothetical protein